MIRNAGGSVKQASILRPMLHRFILKIPLAHFFILFHMILYHTYLHKISPLENNICFKQDSFMFRSVIGHAEGIDTKAVTRMVIEQCRAQLKDTQPLAGIVFASALSDHTVMLREIRAAFPGLPLAGCSSAGEISAACGFREDSICLILFAGDRISISSGIAAGVSENIEQTAEKALASALSELPDQPVLCLVFSSNLATCPVALIETLHRSTGRNCQVFGGYAAADLFPQDDVYLFHDNDVYTDAVSLLLFSGPLQTAFCISNSWSPMGDRAIVERAKKNRIMQIGGKPAMQFYQDIFGPHPEPLLGMPLAVYEPDGNYYIRAAGEFDASDQSVLFESHIPEGTVVQFTEATPEIILEDTDKTLTDFVSGIDWTPQAALIISCAARKNILGLNAHEESHMIKSRLPADTPFIGFYSYGEIAPVSILQEPRYHNCTMVALLLGEKDYTVPPFPYTSPENQQQSVSDSSQTIELLQKKLARSLQNQEQLEYHKTLAGNMQRRMNEELHQAKKRIEDQHRILKESLTLAQQVQQNLLPQNQPRLPGFEIAGKSIYCDETGGDYFDYIALPEREGLLSVVVGDVSGHGIASALLMATARALLRMRASKEGSPSEIVSDLNQFLSVDVKNSGQFMTLFYLEMDTLKKTMTWVRAGHEPAIRYLPSQKKFDELHGEGLVLGVMDDWEYQEYKTDAMEKGEIILIGTDGIWETRDAQKRFYGKERFMQVVRKNHMRPAKNIVDACLEDVSRFRGSLPVHDDITLVIIKAV